MPVSSSLESPSTASIRVSSSPANPAGVSPASLSEPGLRLWNLVPETPPLEPDAPNTARLREAALAELAAIPESPQAAADVVRAFSGRHGSAAQAYGVTAALAHPLARTMTEPGIVRLGGLFRHWSQPVFSPHIANACRMSQRLSVGQEGYRFGAAALQLHPHFSDQPAPGRPSREYVARQYSLIAGFSPAGGWHASLAGLAQDIWLAGVSSIVPRHDTRPQGTQATVWPTLCGPSLMKLQHGTGIPVMIVNDQPVALGFEDKTGESLLSLEAGLFIDWLNVQTANAPGAMSVAMLDALLTPPLADWVILAREEGHALETGLFRSWLSFVLQRGFNEPVTLALPLQLREELRQLTDSLRRGIPGERIESLLNEAPHFCALVRGLANLQDRIRYCESSATPLPVAGIERDYLNSLLRNLTCALLNLTEPAEVAQFDLLLQACRRNSNQGFNDHAVNHAQLRHLEWVAGTQGGSDGEVCEVLWRMTRHYEQQAEETASDCPFFLDETSRATAAGRTDA